MENESPTREDVVRQRVADFTHSFQSGPGLRTLAHLSRFGMEKETTFVEDSVGKSAFNEGARSVILEIKRWLEFDLTLLGKEQDEQDRIS